MTASDSAAASGTAEPSPDRILGLLQAYQASAVLRAGIELGIFDQIAAGRADVAALAAAIGADPRGTRVLLDGLAALGLLEPAADTYRLSPAADAFLVRHRPFYVGDLANIFTSDWQWHAFLRLPDAVRRGGTVRDDHADTPAHPFWESFATSSRAVTVPAAEVIAQILGPWAEGRRSLEVLDVGCGSGVHAVALGRQHAHARLTLLDWPNVLAITRGVVERAGLGDRTRFIAGDMFEAPLGGPYDLVITSHVFHNFSEAQGVRLLQRLRPALGPGGRIAVHDFVLTDARPVENPLPHLIGVLLLVWTRTGGVHALGAYQRMLAAGGFGLPDVHALSPTGTHLLVAERPA